MTKVAGPIFLVMAGTLVLAFAVSVFIVPFELVSGGVTGISVAIHHLTPDSRWTVEGIVSALSWLLFFVGLLSFGGGFATKTLCSTILYPPMLAILLHLDATHFLATAVAQTGEWRGMLLAALLGGGLIGFGCALTLKGGGSTGGTDVLVLLFCRAFPTVSQGRAFFILDALVILLGFIILREPMHAVCAIASAFSGAMVIGAIL